MTIHKSARNRVAYKLMMTDLIEEIKQVFDDTLSIETMPTETSPLGFNLRKEKWELEIYYSIDLMMADDIQTVSVSVKSSSKENRQMIISTFIQQGKNSFHKTIFIGKGEKQSKIIYMVELEPNFSNLSLAKLNTKLFTPFGRLDKPGDSDNVRAPFTMVNMDFYIVEEPNQSIQNSCEYLKMIYSHETNRLFSLRYLHYTGSLIAQYAVHYQGNWYVKGTLKKFKKNHAILDNIPHSNDSKWRRVVHYNHGQSTVWRDYVGAIE